MIAMRPIREYDVIELLNAGRFSGDVEGYVVMNGPEYLGHMLYRVDGAVTRVLECGVENTALIDGAVRACVAAGEHAGASAFAVKARPRRPFPTKSCSAAAQSTKSNRRAAPPKPRMRESIGRIFKSFFRKCAGKLLPLCGQNSIIKISFGFLSWPR